MIKAKYQKKMSSSSSEDDEIDRIEPYYSRVEWKDVIPTEQDDGPYDIVKIAYTDKFKEVFGYLRTILKTNEISDRAFELTKDAALLNPANYTVWYYRRLLIKNLQKDLNEERKFITRIIRENPKNYQVWQHRKSIIEMLQDPSEELEFISEILNGDSKNYHAWQYRQYVLKTFGLWDNELDYINGLIEQDIKNNSAWNQRHFYFNNTNGFKNEQLVKDEIEFCKNKIEILVDNESVWNYLRALIRVSNEMDIQTQDLMRFCKNLNDEAKEDEKSPFLIAFILDSNRNNLNEIIKTNDQSRLNEFKQLYTNSLVMLNELADKYDVIRAKYWKYEASKWKQEFEQIVL